jgi:hypothetical protein
MLNLIFICVYNKVLGKTGTTYHKNTHTPCLALSLNQYGEIKMKIEIDGYEVEEAILDYIKKKYGISVRVSEDDPCMTLESQERVVAYQKHKNGRIKKHSEHGYSLVDNEKSTWKTIYTHMEESDQISFYVDEIEDD